MNRRTVKCFKGYAQSGVRFNIEVLYTLPDYYHTKLFTCLRCGALYCADQDDMDCSGRPFDAVIADLECQECQSPLSATLAPYPESFRMADGTIGHFTPSPLIPADQDSLSVDFWNLYT